MPSYTTGQRRYPRTPYQGNVEFCLPSHPQNELFIAKGSNISAAGVCIYSFKHLKEGQDIEFRSKLPVPYHRATVRWVKQSDRGIYKVGVMFTG